MEMMWKECILSSLQGYFNKSHSSPAHSFSVIMRRWLTILNKSKNKLSKMRFIIIALVLLISLEIAHGRQQRRVYLRDENSRPFLPPLPNLERKLEFPETNKPILMSIYYETICPDSLRFVSNQILSLLKTTTSSNNTATTLEDNILSEEDDPKPEIDSLVEFHFIPYGKAVTLETPGESSGHTFICQHGPLECEGNKLSSCFLNKVSKRSITSYQITHFLVCIMNTLIKSDNQTASSALDSCFSDIFSSGEEILKEEIESCLNTEEGSNLLKENGDLTHALEPKLYYVPWITYNGIWTKKTFEQSRQDVKKVLCSLLTPRTMKYYKVLECQKYEKEIPKEIPQRFRFRSQQAEFRLMPEVYRRTRGMRRPTRLANNGGRGFLHSNSDSGMMMGPGGGAGWRWRTSVQVGGNQMQDWRWRKPNIGIQEVH